MIAMEPILPFVRQRSPRLTFSPCAWLKLQYFCHAGHTEIAGFGITAKADLLYVEDFVTVRQQTSSVTVAMADDAVADFMDRCVDAGLAPQQFLRIWCHTHPGSSAEPSGIDEETFTRVFGSSDWAIMFILSRAGNTYARASFNVGPGATTQFPVVVDWSAWPALVSDPRFSLANLVNEWQAEFADNIQPFPERFSMFPSFSGAPLIDAKPEPFEFDPDKWTDLDQQIWEEYEHHARCYDD